MKVVLLKDVTGLGSAGRIQDVKEGYARNYLLPRGLALEATEGALKALKSQQQTAQQRTDRVRADAEQLAKRLEHLVVTIPARAGEGGRLFGSVTAQDITDALVDQGLKISKKQVELSEPIRSAGFFKVAIRLAPQLLAQVDVNVVGTR